VTDPSSHSFTLRADKILRAINSEVRISFGFNPSTPPNPTPALQCFQAVWDTGATNTAISQKVVNECELKPVGVTVVSTAGGVCETEVYLINIFLPNQVGFPGITVTKADLGPCDVLIGMDVICKGDFALTHQNGKTVFSFRYPSMTTIDFLQG
jgi:predicted aspartyl protease